MMVYMQMLDTINIHNQPVNYDRLVLDFNSYLLTKVMNCEYMNTWLYYENDLR